MNIRELGGVTPSPQEKTLLALQDGAYGTVIEDVKTGLTKGRSPSFLSVARPDLALGFARAWQAQPAKVTDIPAIGATYKRPLFEEQLARAHEGEPGAVAALAKFATTPNELSVVTGVMLDNPDALGEWSEDRKYMQLLGSFNPQHIGHRTTIRLALDTVGDSASAIAHVVDVHPIKGDSLPPYEGRFVAGEQKLYESTLIDNTRATQLDVPAGVGLAPVGVAQIELIAETTGDEGLRWLVGSDKFMTDVASARKGREKVIDRFSEPRIHLYVARRADHDPQELQAGVEYVVERFDTKVTLVKEPEGDDVLTASASKIRGLRAEGRHEEADNIEFADLPRH